jgi:hypothetical protein
MSEHEILFTNAAVQNRSFDIDQNPGKVSGIIAAQLLNRLFDNPDVVHCWNNVGLFDEAETTTSDERLEHKYDSQVLKQHLTYWGTAGKLVVQTDDEEWFSTWAVGLVESCLERGDIYIQNTTFSRCAQCDLVIAESAAHIDQCGRCKGQNLDVVKEDGLFVDVPDDRQSLLLPENLYNSINIYQERDSFKQLPPRLLLSRDRSRGVNLERIGLTDKVLDPRLGIGLLAVYAASIRGYEKGCLVQSLSTLVRTAPYLNSVIVDADRQGIP